MGFDWFAATLDEGLPHRTNGIGSPANGHWQSTSVESSFIGMAVLITFLLGIVNFALHRAVLESRHRLLREMPLIIRQLAGRASLIAEFCLLLGAMLLIANGHEGWGWAYVVYSAVNAASAWLLLNQKL